MYLGVSGLCFQAIHIFYNSTSPVYVHKSVRFICLRYTVHATSLELKPSTDVARLYLHKQLLTIIDFYSTIRKC